MEKIKVKLYKVCKFMVICGLLFCIPLQVFAQPSKPGRVVQETGTFSGLMLILGVAGVAIVGGIAFLKKSGAQDKKKITIQPETQKPASYTANQNSYDYSDLEPTVAMDATVGWNPGVKSEKWFSVKVIKGVYEGREYQLTGQRTTIGRAADANIRYPADTGGISRRHCQILKDTKGLMLMDLESSWGTIIEGKGKIPANQPVIVSEGDRIYLGSDENILTICVET